MLFDSTSLQSLVQKLPPEEKQRLANTLQHIQIALCKGNVSEALHLSSIAVHYYESQYFSTVSNG